MTEGAWPHGFGGQLRVRYGARAWVQLQALAAHLVARRAYRALGPLGDACTRTHVHLRPLGAERVHRVAARIMLPGYRTVYRTACGVTLPVRLVVFTATAPNCLNPGCVVRSQRKPERPTPVDVPGGALHGEAAKNNYRRHGTSNTVADRVDRDPFRSMKNATDNRVMVGPGSADQVATA